MFHNHFHVVFPFFDSYFDYFTINFEQKIIGFSLHQSIFNLKSSNHRTKKNLHPTKFVKNVWRKKNCLNSNVLNSKIIHFPTTVANEKFENQIYLKLQNKYFCDNCLWEYRLFMILTFLFSDNYPTNHNANNHSCPIFW